MKRQEELNEAWCKYMGKCSTEIIQALSFALRWCDEHPHWISVEDELPPKEKNVLIWSSGSKEVMIGYYIGRNWQRKTNDFYSYVDDGYWHNVTHWMPLMAPPQKGGEE